MKVLHVVQHLHKVSGVTSFVVPLCDALNATGVECDIAVKDPLDPDCLPSETNVRRTALDDISSHYDVVHIHNLWTPFLHKASNMARRKGIPVVWSVHGALSPWAFKYKWWKKCLPWHLYQHKDLLNADVVHVTAKAEECWTRDVVGASRYEIIPMGARLPGLCASTSISQRRVLLFVGRLAKVKALDRLVESFNRIEHRGWSLRIVGQDVDGTLSNLREFAGNDVEFVGPKTGGELQTEYRNCSVLALVSHTENFGAVVLEAMAHGKPVLTSRGTPWSEAPGWWVDNDVETLSKTLQEVFSTPIEDLERKGTLARQFVEDHFAWDVVAGRFKDMYASLVLECVRRDGSRGIKGCL